MADKLAPFLQIGRGSEVDGMILQRLPLHEQPVALRVFMRTLQGHAAAASLA